MRKGGVGGGGLTTRVKLVCRAAVAILIDGRAHVAAGAVVRHDTAAAAAADRGQATPWARGWRRHRLHIIQRRSNPLYRPNLASFLLAVTHWLSTLRYGTGVHMV